MINQLLNEVQTISESYKRVAEATGENFNIFTLLQMETDEVVTHSNFIAELLNPSGSHGLKDTFLREFIGLLKVDNFETDKVDVRVEYFISNISLDYTRGGRIDILLRNSVGRVIMIENKIYAAEQHNQLLRYHNAFPEGVLVYLTLFGEASTQVDSKEVPYLAISYKDFIITWLEQCKKEAVNVPVLRECIGQYINLIKKLTNQNYNQKMNADIVNRVLKDEASFDAFKLLLNTQGEVLKRVLQEDVFPFIEEVANEFSLTCNFNKDEMLHNTGNWMGFSFTNDKLIGSNIKICFCFNVKNGYRSFIFGFSYINLEDKGRYRYDIVQQKYSSCFGQFRETNWWPCWKDYAGFANWDSIETLQRIRFGGFREDFRDKLKKMVEMVN